MADPRPSPSFEVNGVDVEFFISEEAQSPAIRECWGDRGLEVSINFMVDWFDRIAFLQGLRGAASFKAADAGQTVFRSLPVALPDITGEVMPQVDNINGDQPYAWDRYICVGTGDFTPLRPRVDSDGSVTGQVGWLYYDKVIIPARFASPSYFVSDSKVEPGTPGYDLSGYPYTTTVIKPTGEFFSAYIGGYKFLNTPGAPDVNALSFIRPKTEIEITRHYMPMIDVDNLDSLIGTVNKVPLPIGTTTYPAESVLYLSYEVESYGDVSTGLTYYDIKHHLVANGPILDQGGNPQQSWNYFLTPANSWDRLANKLGQADPYPTRDVTPDVWPDYP